MKNKNISPSIQLSFIPVAESKVTDDGTAFHLIGLPDPVNKILMRRALHHKGGVSGYIAKRLTYDLTRSHRGGER
jgi:hypothetical protein